MSLRGCPKAETRPGDWAGWLGAAGLGLVPGTRQMRFDHLFVTPQAATDGLGLAIGPFPVLDGDAARGRFATPFPTIRLPRPSYFLLIPADADKTRALRASAAWLVGEGNTVFDSNHDKTWLDLPRVSAS